MKTVDELLKNDRVQNQLALYYLFEYGKQTLNDNYELSKIKEQIKENNKGKNPILSTDYIFQAIDIAKDMSNLSVADIKKFIIEDTKINKKQERNLHEQDR